VTTFNGTQIEIQDLLLCIERYCTCCNGYSRGTCPTHEILRDQHILDFLIFYRRQWFGKGKRVIAYGSHNV
jgi:hypothetical protein